MKVFLVVSLLLIGTPFLMHGQHSVHSSSENKEAPEGSVSYSIGQVMYISSSDGFGSVSEGVQQAFEISVPNSLDESIKLEAIAYPNPTTNTLYLKLEEQKKQLVYTLYDVNGQQKESREIKGLTTEINFSGYTHGIYMLKVTQGQKEIKSFKIVKH